MYRGYDRKAKVEIGCERLFFANFAGWDNEPRLVPRKEVPMTFTYAVIADGGIVLCADSQVKHTHRDQLGNVVGTYKGSQGKIRRFRDRFAFSICGNAGLVDTLLAEVDESLVEKADSFEKAVQVYQLAFQSYVKAKYTDQPHVRSFGIAFLFCGFVIHPWRSEPLVVKLDIASDFLWNPVTGRNYAATGAERHGAAFYLHHRFYREGMPLEQAKLLAYCAAAEVADLDDSVEGPIEMEIITPEGSRPLNDLKKYENARRGILEKVRSSLAAFQ